MLKLSTTALVLFALSAPALPAQGRTALSYCGRAPGDRCRTVIITETSSGLQFVAGLPKQLDHRVNVSSSLGFVAPMTQRLGLGVVATVGMWDGIYLGAGPRLRYHTSPTMAIDFSPILLIERNTGWNGGSKGRSVLDASVMYRDRVGVSFQLASFRARRYLVGTDPQYPYAAIWKADSWTVLAAGLRLGSKPGRFGVLVGVVAALATAAAFAMGAGGG